MNSHIPPALQFDHYFRYESLPKKISGYFSLDTYPWDLISHIEDMGLWADKTSIATTSDIHHSVLFEGNIRIGDNVIIDPSVTLKGPLIIEDNCNIEHGTTLGPYSYISHGCKVGHASVIARSLLFSSTEIGSGSRILNSIVGSEAKILMGTMVLSPLKTTTISYSGELYMVKQFGALIGEAVMIGINCIINPGSLIGMGATIDTLCVVDGYIPPFTNIQNDGDFG